jgi:hypothetical protein
MQRFSSIEAGGSPGVDAANANVDSLPADARSLENGLKFFP